MLGFTFVDFKHKLSRQISDVGFEVSELDGPPHVGVAVLVEGVQVHAEITGEQNRVLK